MDQAELRAAQTPIKQRFREHPETALITLSAAGTLDDQGIACSVDTGRALVDAGLHPATGGTGELACSGDMLLQALVACAGVTLRAVATSLGLEVTGSVRADGDLDFRGTLGIVSDEPVPVGFRSIRLTFSLAFTGDHEPSQVDRLMALTERYCVVYQTLARGVPVAVALDGIGG